MSACRRMFALGVVCLATFSAGQVSDQMAAARVLGPHWREISRASGMVFSGTVLSVEAQSMGKGRPLPVILTKLRVDRAIVGVAQNEVVPVREWAGSWDTHRAMSVGQRMLLFLYPPSRLGLTSPVGGRFGLIALDARGEIIAPHTSGDGQSAERLESATPVAEHFVDRSNITGPAPEGAPDTTGLAVSLKRYPDSKLSSSATLLQLERAISSARGNR